MDIFIFDLPSFTVGFLFFAISIFISCYIPGRVLILLGKSSFSKISTLTLSLIIGISLWTIQGFIFGFLNVRFLTYIYLILFLIAWLQTGDYKNYFKKKYTLKLSKSEISFILLISTGISLQLLSVFLMGIQQSNSITYCCGNLSDNFWFLSLSRSLTESIPPQEPGMAGLIVHNYHYLANIFVAELNRIFKLPLFLVQFQYSYVLISTLLGLSAYTFGKSIKNGSRFTFWLIFMLYFGGDFIWLLMTILNKGTNLFSMSSIENGSSFLINPPRAFAIVLFFGGITLLKSWMVDKKNLTLGIIASIVLGSLIGFKVYVGLFVGIGMTCLLVLFLFKRRFKDALIPIICFVIMVILYFPVNLGAGGLYYTGFWFFENFIVQPYLQLERLELARVVYLEHGNWIRSLTYDLLFVGIATFSLFGTKLLGFLQTRNSLKIFPFEFHIFLIAGLITSFIIGFFFQQTSGGSNTFNFQVNAFIIGSIYTASAVCMLTSVKKFRLGILISIFIVLLTIPRVIYEARLNIQRITTNSEEGIHLDEIKGYNFLKSQDTGLVVVDHTHFSLDESTPLVYAYTGQKMFLSGIQILESHGIDVTEIKKDKNDIFMSDVKKVADILDKNNISYIVLGPKTDLVATETARFIDMIYKNKKIKIAKVNKVNLDKYIFEIHEK